MENGALGVWGGKQQVSREVGEDKWRAELCLSARMRLAASGAQ